MFRKLMNYVFFRFFVGCAIVNAITFWFFPPFLQTMLIVPVIGGLLCSVIFIAAGFTRKGYTSVE